jgi:hypothetical protein
MKAHRSTCRLRTKYATPRDYFAGDRFGVLFCLCVIAKIVFFRVRDKGFAAPLRRIGLAKRHI